MCKTILTLILFTLSMEASSELAAIDDLAGYSIETSNNNLSIQDVTVLDDGPKELKQVNMDIPMPTDFNEASLRNTTITRDTGITFHVEPISILLTEVK